MKHAPTQLPVADVVRRRWSARSFADRPVTEETLHTVFEAASWAASAMNEQPWLYVYAHHADTEAFERLLGCLLPGNQPWAKDAPVLVLSLARKNFRGNGAPNRHYMHDAGMANATLLLQATELELYGHAMGGFDIEKTRQVFQLPDDVEPVIFLALGYLGEAERLEEPFRTRELAPRARKPLAEFVFEGILPAAPPAQ